MEDFLTVLDLEVVVLLPLLPLLWAAVAGLYASGESAMVPVALSEAKEELAKSYMSGTDCTAAATAAEGCCDSVAGVVAPRARLLLLPVAPETVASGLWAVMVNDDKVSARALSGPSDKLIDSRLPATPTADGRFRLSVTTVLGKESGKSSFCPRGLKTCALDAVSPAGNGFLLLLIELPASELAFLTEPGFCSSGFVGAAKR
jgi:hypothetical protein